MKSAARFLGFSSRWYIANVILLHIVASLLLVMASPPRVATAALDSATPPVPSGAAPPSSRGAAAPTRTASTDELRPGQRAVVRTVFQGSKVEEFDAEIVGVMRGGRAAGDLVVARATSERVIKSGIAQGMSGSPVYVDDKLIGALSSSWSFVREPLFGITPIGEMLEVLDHPSANLSESSAGPSGAELGGSSTGVRFGEFRWDDDPTPDLDPAAPAPDNGGGEGEARSARYSDLKPLALPLSCTGLHASAFEPVRKWLAPFGFAAVPGGRAVAGGPDADSMVPGSAVAIDLMRGDLELSAIGTLTYRDADRVLLFGHPFFQSGDVRLPLATAEITTVVPNQEFSFKLGVRGRPAGMVTQDRRAAVAGRLGGGPQLLPLAVEVTGTRREPQRFRFESIEDRQLAPTLIAIAGMNSLLESGGIGANQTLRWKLRLYRHGVVPLTLSDVVVSDNVPAELGISLVTPLRFLLNNPYQRLVLDSVSIAVQVEPGREQWTLKSARVRESSVRPGGRVRVRCDLERWRGGREAREFSLTLPMEIPNGRYLLWVGGGAELSRYEASRLPGRYRPTSLDDAWRRLGSLRSSDGLYAALFARAPEVSSEGRDYPELPTSALPLLSSRQSAGDRSRRGDLAKLDETRLPLDGQLRGELQVQIDVDSQAP